MKTICIEDFQSRLFQADSLEHQSEVGKNFGSAANCQHCMRTENGLYCTLAQEILSNIPAELLQKVTFKKGEYLFRAGQVMSSIYFLQHGYIKAEYVLPTGQYQVNQIAMAGDCLGMDGVPSSKYQLDVIALNDCEVFRVNFSKLNEELISKPKLHLLYEKLVSLNLIQMQNHIFSLGSHNAEQKLVYFLLIFFAHDKSSYHEQFIINLPMGREDLASFLGMTIESLSRAFAYLEKNHLLKVSNRQLTNIDTDGLMKLLRV